VAISHLCIHLLLSSFVCLFVLSVLSLSLFLSLSLAPTLAAFCAIGKSMAAAAAATFGVMLLSSLLL
jgi:hypothetical protein